MQHVHPQTRGADEPVSLGTHDFDVRAAAISPDGRLGLTVNGNEAKLWDLAPNAARRERWAKRTDGTFAPAAAFTSDGTRVFGVTVHGHVVGWDLVHDRQVPDTASLDVTSDLKGDAVFSADGSLLLGTCGSVLCLWDTRSGRVVPQMSGHLGRVNAVAMTADGRLAASGGDDHLVKVWDLHSGRELVTLEGHDARVVSVCLSPAGDRVFTAAEDRRLLAWDLALPGIYRDFAPRLAAVRTALHDQPGDPAALRSLAEWYSFRGLGNWAAQVMHGPH